MIRRVICGSESALGLKARVNIRRSFRHMPVPIIKDASSMSFWRFVRLLLAIQASRALNTMRVTSSGIFVPEIIVERVRSLKRNVAHRSSHLWTPTSFTWLPHRTNTLLVAPAYPKLNSPTRPPYRRSVHSCRMATLYAEANHRIREKNGHLAHFSRVSIY